MSQQSEERLSGADPAEPSGAPSAQILHMKSRNYDLQRAIQQRAQESVEREQALDKEERRPKPLKWLIIAAIAAIPIVLTLFAVDSFLRVFHKYLDTAATSAPQNEPAESSAAAPETILQSNQPGVVLLQPISPSQPMPAQQPAAPAAQQSDSAAKPPKN